MKEAIKRALGNLKDAPESEMRALDDADNVVLENCIEWLRWQNERIEQLEKALEEIAEFDIDAVYGYRDEWTESYGFSSCQVIARQALGKEEHQ